MCIRDRNMNYVYVLSKKAGVWTMTLPYKPILSDLVKGRVDFNKTHASKLYAKSAVAKTGGKITSATKSLWSTNCSGNPTYF